MIIVRQPALLSDLISQHKATGLSTGFVPTMGALHSGHLELVRASKAASDKTICSIFVNPTQFNDPNDYKKYPQTLQTDIRLLAQLGADILFIPSVTGLYPQGLAGLETYDLGILEKIFEGRYRPGHFQGVCQVMSRLLKLIQPEKLFMGQKDYQQCIVIGRLLEIIELTVHLITFPTVRESDGLAMSSRNTRLNPEQRAAAPEIFRTLQSVKKELCAGDLEPLRTMGLYALENAGFRPDYIGMADAGNLEPLDTWDGQRKIVILVAAFLGEIRLIDNLLSN